MSAVRVWLLPGLLAARGPLTGCTAVVIDQLRATSTMTQALAEGAACVWPCVSVDDARALAAARKAAGANLLTGGERHGVCIEGFDLDNTPAGYTRERVAGREIVFTTTNGTAALAAAANAGASRVLLGCLANLSAVLGALSRDADEPTSARDVHLICAGTGGEVSQDDCLVAGAIAHALLQSGRWHAADDDSVRMCIALWHHALSDNTGRGVLRALQESRGGRNLIDIGLGADVEWCAQVDRLRGVVGVYDCATRKVQTEEST